MPFPHGAENLLAVNQPEAGDEPWGKQQHQPLFPSSSSSTSHQIPLSCAHRGRAEAQAQVLQTAAALRSRCRSRWITPTKPAVSPRVLSGLFFALSSHWLSPSGFAKQISLWCGGGGGVGHLLICQVNSPGSRGRRAGHPSHPDPTKLPVRFGGHPAPRHPLAAQRLLLAPFSVRSTSR